MEHAEKKLQLAIEARTTHRTAQAIKILRSLMNESESEQAADVWGNLIAAYLEAGMFKQAEDAALRRLNLIEQASTEANMVRFQLASARQRQGEFQAAVRDYTEILKWEPYLARCDDSGFVESVRLQLAVCLAHLGNNLAALELLKKINIGGVQSEQRAEAAYYLGQCYYELRNYEMAVYAYSKAMEGPVSAFTVRARYSVGLALWQLHRDSEALDALLPLVDRPQSDIPQKYLYSLLSRIYVELGKIEQAHHFEELAKLPHA